MKEDTKTLTTFGRLRKAAAIGGILLAATACTAVEEFIISEELDGTSWRAVSIDGVAIPQDVEVTMNFAADSSVSGLAGCNNYRVQNVRTEGGVAFTQIAATRKLCPEPQMSTEALFVDALSRVNNFRHNREGQLMVFGRDTVILLDPAT